MSVNAIRDKDGKLLGYSVNVRKRTKYFACRKFGLETSKRLAEELEQKLISEVTDWSPGGRVFRNDTKTTKSSKIGVSGIHLHVHKLKTGKNSYYVVGGLSKRLTGKPRHTSVSIRKHGLEHALAVVFELRILNGLINPPMVKTMKLLRKRMAELDKQSKN